SHGYLASTQGHRYLFDDLSLCASTQNIKSDPLKQSIIRLHSTRLGSLPQTTHCHWSRRRVSKLFLMPLSHDQRQASDLIFGANGLGSHNMTDSQELSTGSSIPPHPLGVKPL